MPPRLPLTALRAFEAAARNASLTAAATELGVTRPAISKQIKQLDLIVLDELGYVPTGKVGAELLFDVLSTAYERQSLIVTTNLPFEQWTEVLGSERLTGAALDRLTHRCHILEAKGESFRLRDARRRQRRAAGTA